MKILTISAVLGVAIGDYFYLSALRNLGAGLNAIVGTTFSLSIFILSYLMFGEVIALRGYFGGVLVISGIGRHWIYSSDRQAVLVVRMMCVKGPSGMTVALITYRT